ncbi:hypothetical protein OBBRIDRAFT_795927 [Obba rivulosa]|uniref:FHA domain-containing protein n=1 Tax=Obba rivulosa TaxID=1052685 RepID=A0A8E2ANI4_9APHY|nr:hypothetical protein OBBRIDRAFT_795927 [Obba rivulosa]
MWVLTGPFDGTTEDTNFQKSKLLKAGTSYTVGRKGQPLIIKHPKISRVHATFIVGECTEDNAEDPNFVPTLSFHNAGNRPRNIVRDGQTIVINNEATKQLQDGDIVHVVTGTPVIVRWERVCCYSSPRRGQSPSLQACASLGISVVNAARPEVTHHLTPTFTLTPNVATSLLSLAHIVKPDWLTEVIRLGTPEPDSEKPSSLEEHFILPPLTKFRPAFSPSLPPALKKFGVWEPDEARANLFRAHRFIFVGERGREVQDALRELVRWGGAEYECFAAGSSGRAWHQVLAKGKGKDKTIVLVADERTAITAVGVSEWKELVGEARSFGLRFIPPEKIIEAVAYADISHIDSTAQLSQSPEDVEVERSASPLPDIVYNTHPDEPSIPPEQPLQSAAPKRRLPPRRAASKGPSHTSSRAPSLPPLAAPSEVAAAETPATKPRRTLVRRAGKSSYTIPGLDDAIQDMIQPGAIDTDKVLASSATLASGAPPSSSASGSKPRFSRLKRRAGSAQPSSLALLGLSDDIPAYMPEPAAEPAHKRFKALFDESDPDRIAAASMEEYLGLGSQIQQTGTSVTQSESAETQQRATRLMAVPEEEEESGPATLGAGSGIKRKSQEEDVDMEVATQARTKRRAVENVDAVEASTPRPSSRVAEKPPSKPAPSKAPVPTQGHKGKPVSGADAELGAPDKDEAFLRAVASTKRGRRAEDDFDREFNNLRISKPDLVRDEQHAAWAVLDDFGDDSNIRGNFMVIVEMEVPERTRDRPPMVRRGGGRVEWEGRPDFKKFKKKSVGERRRKIELYPEGGDDLESQRPHAKPVQKQTLFSSQTLSQTQSQPKESRVKPASRSQTQRKGRGRGPFAEDSDDELVAPSQPPRTAMTQPPPEPPEPAQKPRARRTQTQTQPLPAVRKKTMPLFLSDDEDESQPAKGSARPSDGDEEFDMNVGEISEESEPELLRRSTQRTTRSSQAKQPTRSSRAVSLTAAPAAPSARIADDDSDDEATFKGFAARRK